MKMGDTTLITPENENYEPIQIKCDEAKILEEVILYGWVNRKH
ncbi:hypothetical protein [Clostridium tagluense]|nr:hypothetical protein [Clostridium tagluense]